MERELCKKLSISWVEDMATRFGCLFDIPGSFAMLVALDLVARHGCSCWNSCWELLFVVRSCWCHLWLWKLVGTNTKGRGHFGRLATAWLFEQRNENGHARHCLLLLYAVQSANHPLALGAQRCLRLILIGTRPRGRRASSL